MLSPVTGSVASTGSEDDVRVVHIGSMFFTGGFEHASFAERASIMPWDVSTAVMERTCGERRRVSRPVPQPISRMSSFGSSLSDRPWNSEMEATMDLNASWLDSRVVGLESQVAASELKRSLLLGDVII